MSKDEQDTSALVTYTFFFLSQRKKGFIAGFGLISLIIIMEDIFYTVPFTRKYLKHLTKFHTEIQDDQDCNNEKKK